MSEEHITKVFNLASREELYYVLLAPMAVVAAYAHERKDYNTWMYQKYHNLLEYTPATVTCGDWTAMYQDVNAQQSVHPTSGGRGRKSKKRSTATRG